MDRQHVINHTVEYIKEKFAQEFSGHDWWHIYRVWKMAQHIAKGEKDVDMFVIELAALLHDIADWKFNDGDETAGAKAAREWLEKLNVKEDIIQHICNIINNSSFKGAGVNFSMETKEGMIVQDADRLDAIGAIGIGRVFAYGGNKGQKMHTPGKKPVLYQTAEEYKRGDTTTINHFYEKLLLVKDLMNTQTAKNIAEDRHKFMEDFLERFYCEWEGKS